MSGVLRKLYIRLVCQACQHTLAWQHRASNVVALARFGADRHVIIRTSTGPNGKRLTFSCQCGATPVVLESTLVRLAQEAPAGKHAKLLF